MRSACPMFASRAFRAGLFLLVFGLGLTVVPAIELAQDGIDHLAGVALEPIVEQS